jgi:lipopolysaccharide transport system permease protein
MADSVLRTSRPEPVLRLLNPVQAAGSIWRHRDLVVQFAIRWFASRFRGTHLGVIWAILLPLLILSVYTFVFTYIFTYRSPGENETRPQYAVWLFCGMAVFGLFAASVNRACGLILDHPQYVNKVVFPLETLCVANLGASIIYAAAELLLVVIGTLAVFGSVPATILLLPIAILPMLPLALGVSWFLCSLTVFVRDIANVVSLFVSQFLFFLTPIFWRREQFLATLPDLAWLMDYNPIALTIECVRRCMITGLPLDWWDWAKALVFGLIIMQLGYAWFMKSKRGFADVL